MTSLKLKFFTWHLFSSVIVISAITVLCLYIWFPSPFIQIDGTWKALAILACVDIIIGPLLTLLLVSSKKSKRELRLDFALIIIVQLSALTYGLIQIEKERVWALVHLDGMFNVVPKKKVPIDYLTRELNLPQYNGIYYAMVLNSELLLNAQEGGGIIYYSPKRYHPVFTEQISNISIKYMELPTVIKKKYNSDYLFKFLAGKKQDAVIIFNRDNELVDIMLIPNE